MRICPGLDRTKHARTEIKPRSSRRCSFTQIYLRSIWWLKSCSTGEKERKDHNPIQAGPFSAGGHPPDSAIRDRTEERNQETCNRRSTGIRRRVSLHAGSRPDTAAPVESHDALGCPSTLSMCSRPGSLGIDGDTSELFNHVPLSRGDIPFLSEPVSEPAGRVRVEYHPDDTGLRCRIVGSLALRTLKGKNPAGAHAYQLERIRENGKTRLFTPFLVHLVHLSRLPEELPHLGFAVVRLGFLPTRPSFLTLVNSLARM